MKWSVLHRTCLVAVTSLFVLGQEAVVSGAIEDEEREETGVLRILHEDYFPEGRCAQVFYLEKPESGKKMKVRFAKQPRAKLQSGAKVRLKGRKKGEEFLVAAGGESTMQATEFAQAIASGEQRTLVIAINLIGKQLSCSREAIEDLVFTGTKSVDDLYQETSYGNLWFSGAVVGPYSIPYGANSCDYDAWAEVAETAAQADGVDLSQFNRRVYVFPSGTACGWAGLGTLGGNPSQSWIAYCHMPDVIAHELGHNLSMHHASTDEDNDGTVDCEYCDLSDFMGYGGSGWKQVNAPHKSQMGWLPANKVVTITGPGTYAVAPLAYDPDSTPHPLLLKVARAGTEDSYFFSYRRAVGYDTGLFAEYKDRLSVHRHDGTGWSQSAFIAALGDGDTFEDPAMGISVTQVSHGTDFATVTVSYGCSPATPDASISPTVRTAREGDTVDFTVTIANRDGSRCPNTVFHVTPQSQAGWSASAPVALSLEPGQTRTAQVSFTAQAGVAEGSHPLRVTIGDGTGSSHDNSVVAACVIEAPPTGEEPPSGVTDLKVRVNRSNRVKLTWKTSARSAAGLQYDVYRDQGSGFTRIARVPKRKYIDQASLTSSSCRYRVVAVDSLGAEVAESNIVATGPLLTRESGKGK